MSERIVRKLKPVESVSLQQQVVQRLTQLIEEEGLGPGDKLPSERALSEHLQVSRGTVREAVQFLHALGLAEIRHGAGTFVRAPAANPDEASVEWRRWTKQHSSKVHDLLEMRRGLECFAAELAAHRALPEQIEKMRAALEYSEAAIEAGRIPSLVDADVKFHSALTEAAGNQALVEFAAGLGEELVRERGAIWGLPGRPKLSMDQHRAIFDAVLGGDAAAAREAVNSHLLSVEAAITDVVNE